MNRFIAAVCSAAIALLAPPTGAQTYPAGFTQTELAGGGSIEGATAMARAPDGRIYIALQTGELKVWDPASGLQAQPFFTFPVEFNGERGLLGVAVDPNWLSNRYVYAYYSSTSPANSAIITRVTASAADPNTAVGGSAITFANLGTYPTGNDWHVGGGLHFGPDHKLYLALGDNGVSANSQSINNLFGKILRMNGDPANLIPGDNPTSISGIAGTTSGNNRLIWAAGLRNPFTFMFHPVTGRLFINDVGQTDWEEIDEGGPGVNFGWPATEGDFNQQTFPNFRRPFYFYEHGGVPVGGFCIAGGAFYHPAEHAFPADYFGDYFFADYVSAWIKRIDVNTKAVTPFADLLFSIVDMKVDPQGRLLVLTHNGPSRLLRIDYTAALAPTILTHPAPASAPAGGSAAFSVYASGNRTLSYQWRRDGQNLSNGGDFSGVNTRILTVSNVTCQSAGSFDCVVSNAAGGATSNTAALNGQPACYANCDCSTGSPEFNVADFACFIAKFNAGDPYANCDNSSLAPALNIHDFVCFMNKAAAGCP